MIVFPRHALTALICMAIFSGCAAPNVQVNELRDNHTAFPKTVAVLPFTLEPTIKEKESPHVILREVFFNNFSFLGYTDMALDEVDQRLHHAGIAIEEASQLRYMDLRRILGVDAVIRGNVIEANNFTAGIHAETMIQAKLDMIDLETGETIWEVEHTETDYSGIATPTIVDIIQEQMANAKVHQAYYKTSEVFCQRVIAKIPDPALQRLDEVELPVISSIEANIKTNRKLKPKDRIYVSLKGQPGMTATFDIGSWKTSIPMKEITPGLYTGDYTVQRGDQVLSAFIIGTLKNPKGLAQKKYYKAALATIEDGK